MSLDQTISYSASRPTPLSGSSNGRRGHEEVENFRGADHLRLRQAESGTPVADVHRQLGVSDASFYVWKKKYGKLVLTELCELRQLRDENARVKCVVVYRVPDLA